VARRRKEVEALREQLARERTERLQAATKTQPTPEDDKARKLQTENEALRKSLANSEAARQQEALDFVVLRDRERLLRSSVEVLQTSKKSLEVESAGFSDKISKITDNLRNFHKDLS